ncbi:allatostatins MIP [Phlebotomus argentipes]|uniref:allatostatins MIP n=1 Tax=Phlebotomus argentipes TaxID=94469 RepID=UPI002892FF08|nr:allatostatins MIP [Phlebotomus argentipes]
MNRGVRLTLVLLWGLWMAANSLELAEEDSGDAKRSWNNLQASWGKRWPDELDDIDDTRLEAIAEPLSSQKRTWKAINGAWGKRVTGGSPGGDWNKFRSAWGKREPGWNNLKGLWGKRSTNNWNRLSSGWGKRFDADAEMDI